MSRTLPELPGAVRSSCRVACKVVCVAELLVLSDGLLESSRLELPPSLAFIERNI